MRDKLREAWEHYVMLTARRIPCPKLRKLFHGAHGAAHLVYFGAVFHEAHGFYSTMGGALLLLGIAGYLLGEGGH